MIKDKNILMKFFLIISVSMFLLMITPTVYSENIGTFKTGDTFQLTNFCNSADCSYMNISSIGFPNGTILYFNDAMTKNGQEFNYSFSTELVGAIYEFKTCADPGGDYTCERDTFSVTRTGAILQPSESYIYFILAFGVLLLFIISFYFLIVTPYGNDIDESGAVIKLTKLKYVKLGLILLSWVLFTWFLNILIGLSDNFVSLTMYYGFFGFIFATMNNLALPFGIIILVIAGFEIVRDTNIYDNIKKFGSSIT